MSEERFREVFRRLTAETLDPPAFDELGVHRAGPPPVPWAQPWVVVIGAAVIVLIVVGGLGFLGGAGPEVATPSVSSTTSVPECVRDCEQVVIPADCPITIPDGTFTPPEGYPAEPASPGGEWYGTNGLWTVLPADGIYTPRKSVWWSVGFPGGGEEPEPPLSVTYELLNSPIRGFLPIESNRATNAHTEQDGWFMIAGIDPEIRGCWQVSAVYKGGSLSYVYYNGYFDDPGTGVPDVVGMSVSSAREILESHGYVASFYDSANITYEVCAQEPGAGLEVLPGATIGMRTALPGSCDELMSPSPDLNPDYLTYEDGLGRLWYATSCPNADVLISGGVDAADGLPMAGETWEQTVTELLGRRGGQPGATTGAVSWEAVRRNGEVWDRDDDGEVVVDQVADFMVEATLAEEAPCPLAPTFWNGVPVAYIRDSGAGRLCPDEPPLGTAQVMVFFDCGNGTEPHPIGFARPLHPDAPDRITSVFWHMLAGPSVNERGRGSGSIFGEVSADALISAELNDGHLIVDFNDGILINNASTSTGSQYLLSELVSNAFGIEEVESVEFRINGSCEGFWAFLQGPEPCQIIQRP